MESVVAKKMMTEPLMIKWLWLLVPGRERRDNMMLSFCLKVRKYSTVEQCAWCYAGFDPVAGIPHWWY